MKSILKYINWLWTDDKTGKHSDTTLRTWIVFLIAAVYVIALCVQAILAPYMLVPLQFELIQWSLAFYGVASGVYLGKRINESRASKAVDVAGILKQVKETVGSRKL